MEADYKQPSTGKKRHISDVCFGGALTERQNTWLCRSDEGVDVARSILGHTESTNKLDDKPFIFGNKCTLYENTQQPKLISTHSLALQVNQKTIPYTHLGKTVNALSCSF